MIYGHGHVRPNPNGVKARCGGPALCPVCAKELAGMPLDGPQLDAKPSESTAGPVDTPSQVKEQDMPEYQTSDQRMMISYLTQHAITDRMDANMKTELAQLDGRTMVSGRWLTYDGRNWAIYPRG